MNSKKVFFAMIGLLVLLSGLGIAGMYFGNSMLQKESGKLVQLKLENQLLDEQQTALTRANQDIETYAELESIAKAIVPQDKDQARAVREIVKIAQETGVVLQTISFPTSTLGQEKPKAAPATPAEDAAPAPAAPAAPAITQVKPVEGIPGVFSLEVSLQSNAANPSSYNNFLEFLARLEQNRRTAQVGTINIQPDKADRNLLTFNLTVSLYIKP